MLSDQNWDQNDSSEVSIGYKLNIHLIKWKIMIEFSDLKTLGFTCVLEVSCTTAFLKFNLVSAFPIFVLGRKTLVFPQSIKS